MTEANHPALVRSAATAMLCLLIAAIGLPTHLLGDTAVVGEGYLWGESSLRCSTEWFVDTAEVFQHALFALTVAVCVWTAISQRAGALALLLGLFGALVVLSGQRSQDFDGGGWQGRLSLEFFTACKFALTLLITTCGLTSWSVGSGAPLRRCG